MDVAERFAEALAEELPDRDGDLDHLPMRLVRAAAAVLEVDGAGLGIHGRPHQRTPLAASDATAALVEELQFTMGAGPCLQAVECGAPVRAVEARLVSEWPAFHDQLVARTPIRSMLALPLPGSLTGLGCFSLYWVDPVGAATAAECAAELVAALVAQQLEQAAAWSPWLPPEVPDARERPEARRRGRLWMAVGMVMLAGRLEATDALALLRAQAFAGDRTVDDLADDLVERRLHPGHLAGEDPLGP
ncbi:ANTAR domain-containing protein [Modestobacter sp. VKM Ac-2983]|uniref:ANTAR domain-containing protein n=1 Tax=Modestobacter sp. VKM Ac-2983 TaxID=3004137 RepID=UPI0022AB76E9|nr:ANTAR domain-containing protein [Modestobacter sp. VKM Ac-2983]MCZ2805550.1 ANTAR domain-containing protein [Modestobacter sp. VKM Ac-2983]